MSDDDDPLGCYKGVIIGLAIMIILVYAPLVLWWLR